MSSPTGSTSLRDRAAPFIACLIALLALRWTFQALYLPVFEGPDEPFHLGRTIDAIEAGPIGFLTSDNERLPRVVDEAIKSHPCSRDLADAFDCPGFDGKGAFNILEFTRPRLSGGWVRNYEAHQPPMSYQVQAIALRAMPGSSRWTVEQLLLFCRFMSVVVSILGAWTLLTLVETREAKSLVFLVLLLPGATEALIRCSNDSLLFLWTAVVMASIKGRQRGFLLVALLWVGPLIKLTAFAVVAFAIGLLWLEGRKRTAAISALASMIVIPIQGLRGWLWGGTQEINLASEAIGEGAISVFAGMLRSFYSMTKTAIWLGNWSFFRPPGWLLVLLAVTVVLWLCAIRPTQLSLSAIGPHAVGAGVAIVGIAVFAIGNRKLFGTWGGVGGWYLWGWVPWLAVAFHETFELREKWRRKVFVPVAGFILLANVMWLEESFRLYGSW